MLDWLCYGSMVAAGFVAVVFLWNVRVESKQQAEDERGGSPKDW